MIYRVKAGVSMMAEQHELFSLLLTVVLLLFTNVLLILAVVLS